MIGGRRYFDPTSGYGGGDRRPSGGGYGGGVPAPEPASDEVKRLAAEIRRACGEDTGGGGSKGKSSQKDEADPTKVDVSVGGAALRLLLHLAERPSLRGKMRAAGVPGGTLAALEAAAAYQPSKEEEEAKAKLAELDAMDNTANQPNAPAGGARARSPVRRGRHDHGHDQGKRGARARRARDRRGGGGHGAACPRLLPRGRRRHVARRARRALSPRARWRREPRCRKAPPTPASAARSNFCDEAVWTAHVVGAAADGQSSSALASCAAAPSGGGGGGGGKGSSGGGDAMELRRSRRALPPPSATMRLPAATTPGSGGGIELADGDGHGDHAAAQLALDALEEARRRRVKAPPANSEKKNAQGVATDMQLIDAAPRAHAFIAYASAGGFTSPSSPRPGIPAMY